MGYPIRKCKCGVEHECRALDPVENGRARWARSGVAQGVERRPVKAEDAGSIPAAGAKAGVAQRLEHPPYKRETCGSAPLPSTNGPDSSNGRTAGFGPVNPRSSRGSGTKMPGEPCEKHSVRFCENCR